MRTLATITALVGIVFTLGGCIPQTPKNIGDLYSANNGTYSIIGTRNVDLESKTISISDNTGSIEARGCTRGSGRYGRFRVSKSGSNFICRDYDQVVNVTRSERVKEKRIDGNNVYAVLENGETVVINTEANGRRRGGYVSLTDEGWIFN